MRRRKIIESEFAHADLLQEDQIAIDNLQHHVKSSCQHPDRSQRGKTRTDQIEQSQQNRQNFPLLLLRQEERSVDSFEDLENRQETMQSEEMRFDLGRFFEDFQLDPAKRSVTRSTIRRGATD